MAYNIRYYLVGGIFVKKFNKIMTCLLCLCCFTFTFAGCELWTLNTNKYLNQTVASYGDITVSLEDVYNAYYNYGNYYFDGQGEVTYDGIKNTATQLLNQKIMVEYLENGKEKITLTPNQINDVWESVYASINSSILTIENNLLSADRKKRVLPSEETEEELTGYQAPYAKYEKTYKYENGVLQKVEEQPEEVETYSADVFKFTDSEMEGFDSLEDKIASMETSDLAQRAYNNFRENYWDGNNHSTTNDDGERYSDNAFSRYISNLRTNESGRNLSTSSYEVFYRELDRLFEAYYENELLTVFQENFNKTDVINENLVISTYKELYNTQKESYSTASVVDGEMVYQNYIDAMTGRSEAVLYHQNAEGWFQVSHVLLRWSDEDVAKLESYKTQLENDDISEEEYNYAVSELKRKNMKFQNRETGEEKTANEILKEIQTALEGKSASDKIQIFNEFIYKYNMDDGANNADYAYYIPTDPDSDSMVTPFANESRKLRGQGVGSISGLVEIDETTGYEDNSGETQTPSYSGYHIIIYLGEIAPTPNAENVTLQQLNDYILNPLNNNETNSKSLLDYVIEQISYSNYSAYESSVLQSLKTETPNYYDAVINQLVDAFR